MLHKLITAAAWATLAYIAFTTLSPIDFRPEITKPDIERFGAYALVGLLLALAYPRRLISIALFVVGFAAALEALQLVMPGRHGQFADALVKAAGGIAGVVTVSIVLHLAHGNPER